MSKSTKINGLEQLNEIAISQMKLLRNNQAIKKLK
jgi:hypothetical protein